MQVQQQEVEKENMLVWYQYKKRAKKYILILSSLVLLVKVRENQFIRV
jgi:hypothetical protein